jgi:hypothetical protein
VEASVSEEAPDILAVNDFLRDQLIGNPLEPPIKQPSIEDAHFDPLDDEEGDLYRFVETIGLENHEYLVPAARGSRVCNPAEDYNLWTDLCSFWANISIAQLIRVAPSLRKEFKEGLQFPGDPDIVMSARIYTSPLIDDGALEIDVTVLDKVIPGALIDGGSGINIMPLSTMERLRLKVTGPSSYVVNVADQRPITPLAKLQITKGSRGRNLHINLSCLAVSVKESRLSHSFGKRSVAAGKCLRVSIHHAITVDVWAVRQPVF